MMASEDASEISVALLGSYEPRRVFGAKEIGEGSMLPVLGAVAYAIDNTTAVWTKDLLITPEKILNAVRAKRATEKLMRVSVAQS